MHVSLGLVEHALIVLFFLDLLSPLDVHEVQFYVKRSLAHIVLVPSL